MALFPSSTHFFINTWTWGYEDVLKAVAHAFHCKVFDSLLLPLASEILHICLSPFILRDCFTHITRIYALLTVPVPKIHFDRYKHSIYSHGSDPFLRALGTRDAASTRFHACERFDRCSFVDVPPYDYGNKGTVAPPSKEGKKVVYVNAVNMSCACWEGYQAEIRRRVLRGENVDSLVSYDGTHR